jgi:hypothetical protein
VPLQTLTPLDRVSGLENLGFVSRADKCPYRDTAFQSHKRYIYM